MNIYGFKPHKHLKESDSEYGFKLFCNLFWKYCILHMKKTIYI